MKPHAKQGFVTLFSIIVLMLLSVAVISGVFVSSSTDLQSNNAFKNGVIARGLAESCGNVALNKLKLDNSYTGDEIINVGDGDCTILPISGSGNTDRTIRAKSKVGDSERKIEINVQALNPYTIINYWNDKQW